MKKRPMGIGLGILAVMCASYLGVSGYTAVLQERQKEESEAAKIYLTSGSTVIEIGYETETLAVDFVKNDSGGWERRDDSEFPVNSSRVDSLAAAAEKLEAVRSLGIAEDLEEYGLEKPAYRFTVKGEDGAEVTLYIGNETSGGEYYARKDGDNLVYTVGDALVTLAGDSLYDWIKLDELPNITSEDITEIRIERDGQTARFLGDEDGWPDEAAVSIAALSVDSCVDFNPSDEKMEEYGLDSQRLTLTYTYTSGDESGTVSLEVGAETEDGLYYYTKLENSKAVNLMLKASVDEILSELQF